MGLNENEYELVSFIEQEYLISGCIPTKEVCLDKLNMSSKKFDGLYNREDFRNAMQARGIPVNLLDNKPLTGILTTQQLLAVNTLLDLNDNRSDSKKLRDLKISTTTFQGWQRDPVFQDYWARRTEALFGDALSEANRAMYDNVKRGDLGAIKLLFEMTGRWSSKPASEVNIEWVLMKVLETIQKHVTDPTALSNIAEDLLGIKEEVVPVVASVKPLQLVSGGFAL